VNSETAFPYDRGASSRGDGASGGVRVGGVCFSARRLQDVLNERHWQIRHAAESTLIFLCAKLRRERIMLRVELG
jgi:hypothetical protein